MYIYFSFSVSSVEALKAIKRCVQGLSENLAKAALTFEAENRGAAFCQVWLPLDLSGGWVRVLVLGTRDRMRAEVQIQVVEQEGRK